MDLYEFIETAKSDVLYRMLMESQFGELLYIKDAIVCRCLALKFFHHNIIKHEVLKSVFLTKIETVEYGENS